MPWPISELASQPASPPVAAVGRAENWPAMSEPLGDKTFDDGFDEVPQGGTFALSGGDRRIEVVFNHGYPAVEIFAPGNDDVVGIEPMTAVIENHLRLRDDVIGADPLAGGGIRDAVLANAPAPEHGFFGVPKVIE